MNINKICIVLMILVAFIGIIGANSSNMVYGAGEQWIKPTNTSVYMTNFYVTIHTTLKNNANYPQYFKISQTYTDDLDSPIQWKIWDYGGSEPMLDSVSPKDYGWEIQPGKTKKVSFTLLAVNNDSNTPLIFNILNKGAVENTYWPYVDDPGLYTSWFEPNEIEMLDPTLDLKYWKGDFSFYLVNVDSQTVSGIIRAPIVPLDSELTASNPKATYIDHDEVLSGNVAAWDVTLGAGNDKKYDYTYVWSPSSASSGIGTYSASIPKTSKASTSPVSTKQTGVPYLPFVVGGILTAGGLVYARLR